MKKYQVITIFTYKNGEVSALESHPISGLKKAKLQQKLNQEWLARMSRTVNAEGIIEVNS